MNYLVIDYEGICDGNPTIRPIFNFWPTLPDYFVYTFFTKLLKSRKKPKYFKKIWKLNSKYSKENLNEINQK